MCIIRDLDSFFCNFCSTAGFLAVFIQDIFCFFKFSCAGKENWIFFTKLLPFEALVFTVYPEAFRIVSGYTIQKTFHFNSHIAVLKRNKCRFEREWAAVFVSQFFADFSGTSCINLVWQMSGKHKTRSNGVCWMHQWREAFPVFRPSFHVLVMCTGHILETSEFSFFIKFLNIE